MKLKTINSERGGIATIIAEIILAAIVLSLLIIVIIPSFNKNREILGAASKKENEIWNLKSQEIIDLEKDTFTGNDVIGAIRYYSEASNMFVDVTCASGHYIYKNESYEENNFSIPRDDIYKISIIYDSNIITGVFFTQNN